MYTRVIRGCKLRSPSWIIGPRRVLLKHRRQRNRTKCIYVTIGDLCELFRAGTTPVTSGRRGSNGKWEHGRTASVYTCACTGCSIKTELVILQYMAILFFISCCTISCWIIRCKKKKRKILVLFDVYHNESTFNLKEQKITICVLIISITIFLSYNRF